MAGRWAAVVLAGGRARRLGGVDKAALTVGGRTLLDGVLAACRGAEPIVVVGPERPTAVRVCWTREQPPHAGPVAALAAGLRAVPAEAEVEVELTAVLAADLPNLQTGTVRALRSAVRHAADDGAVLVDEHGRPQWLCGVWRTAALRAAVAAMEDPRDVAVRAVLGRLAAVRLAAGPGVAFDVDTAEDLRAVRRSRPDAGHHS